MWNEVVVLILLLFIDFSLVACKRDQRCPDGKYGDNCLLNCSANCGSPYPQTIIGPCDKIIGHCLDACKSGFHGSKCNKKCTEHCATCVQQNGRCTKCEKGYTIKGAFCIYESDQCPDNCLMDLCDKDSCVRGCKAGFYGARCDLTCNDACTRMKCTQDSGSCIHGCIQGYEETNSGCKVAEDQCPDNCLMDLCDKDSCVRGCKAGFYGARCDLTCSSACTGIKCAQDSGSCLNGCINGYEEANSGCKVAEEQCPDNCLMDMCDKDSCVRGCKAGFHGVRCNLTCNDACTGMKCAQYSGSCIHGCIHGYEATNSGCKVAEEQCPDNCLMDMCDKDSCVRGCEVGFHGVRCNLTCNDACTEIKCAQDSGSCIHGCIHGYEETNSGCKVAEEGHGSSEENYVPYYAVGAMVLVVLVLSAYVVRRLKRMNILVYGNGKSRRRQPEPCIVAENNSQTEVTHSYYELNEGEMNIDSHRPLSKQSNVREAHPDLDPHPIAGISRRPLPVVPKPLSNPYDEPDSEHDQNPKSEGGAEGCSHFDSIPSGKKNLSQIYYSQYLTCVHESVSCGKCPALSHNATGPFDPCEGNSSKIKSKTL